VTTPLTPTAASGKIAMSPVRGSGASSRVLSTVHVVHYFRPSTARALSDRRRGPAGPDLILVEVTNASSERTRLRG